MTVTGGGSGYSDRTIIYFRAAETAPTIRAPNPLAVHANLEVVAQGAGLVAPRAEWGIVFQADAMEADAMNSLKARGRAFGQAPPACRRWTRHGH